MLQTPICINNLLMTFKKCFLQNEKIKRNIPQFTGIFLQLFGHLFDTKTGTVEYRQFFEEY